MSDRKPTARRARRMIVSLVRGRRHNTPSQTTPLFSCAGVAAPYNARYATRAAGLDVGGPVYSPALSLGSLRSHGRRECRPPAARHVDLHAPAEHGDERTIARPCQLAHGRDWHQGPPVRADEPVRADAG